VANTNTACITHKNNNLPCHAANFLNAFEHRWGFVVDATNFDIQSGDPIEFSGMSLTVTHTVLRPSKKATNPHNSSDKEIYFEAWKIESRIAK